MVHRTGALLLFSITAVCMSTGCASRALSARHIPLAPEVDINRYTGTWYEIARLPNRFEKNLTRVTAAYSLLPDGRIKVVNRGFDSTSGTWKEVTGKAKIPDRSQPALLKVSFFWIFYSDYRIIDLDTDGYSWAMVTGKTKKYLWILSRTPVMDTDAYDSLVRKAASMGFDVMRLYTVPHK